MVYGYVWDHVWAFKDWWIIKDNTVFHQTQDYRIKEKQHSFGQETGVFTDIRGYSRFVLMFIRSLRNFSYSMQATLTWRAHSKSIKKHSSAALEEKDKELCKNSQKLPLYMMYLHKNSSCHSLVLQVECYCSLLITNLKVFRKFERLHSDPFL